MDHMAPHGDAIGAKSILGDFGGLSGGPISANLREYSPITARKIPAFEAADEPETREI